MLVCRYFGLKRSAAQKQQKTINASAKVNDDSLLFLFLLSFVENLNASSALTLLVGRQEKHPACKN